MPFPYQLDPFFDEESAALLLQVANDDDSGDDDDDDEEEEEEEEDDDEDGEEEEPETVDIIDVPDSPRVLQSEVGEEHNHRKSEGGGEALCSTSGSQENGECDRGETEGLFCLICMEAWTSGGEHHVCCLPCGHLYGFSCIKKWLQQGRSSGKCPQCNRKCSLRDVRKIYASRIAAVDDESHKRMISLEAKLLSLDRKDANWCKKEAEWRKTEAELRSEINLLRKRTAYLESLVGDGPRKTNLTCQDLSIPGHNIHASPHGLAPSCRFKPQVELPVDGARIFDINAPRQVVLLARRLSGMGGAHVLTQMSLIPPHETEDILLPPTTRAIKDLHISPTNDGVALFGALGKKLSVISMQSHNIVLSYDLPAAAWSCSWDLNSSHFIYAGLQNGMVLVFDMRQTTGPLASLTGLTSNPVHTIHFLSPDSTTPGVRSLLSASSVGLCQWNIGDTDERPSLVLGTGSAEVCISYAYSSTSDDVVASYRPRVSDDMILTQPSLSPFGGNGQWVQGSHVCFKRTGFDSYQNLCSTCASVDSIRLPKTTIVDLGVEKQLFASWDESTHEIVLQELPSFVVTQRFRSASYPLHDVKFTRVHDLGLLGFLSEDRLQLLTSGSS